MNRNIFISFGFHIFLVIITAMSLPFLARKPIDLPPIVSVELIQIADKTNIPFAPKICLDFLELNCWMQFPTQDIRF